MKAVRTLLSLFAWLCLAQTVVAATGQGVPPSLSTTDNQACMTCHVEYKGHKRPYYHSDCVSCHTVEDSKHMLTGGKNVSFPSGDNCLSCHQKINQKHMNWSFSEHKKAGVQCQDCHGVHSVKQPKQLNLALWKTDKKSAVCMDCHQDIAARMNMPSHHPIKEGGMGCVDCHDPHGGKQTGLMSKNDKCFQCHQSIRGPKVYEHRPVTEDCGNCHNPHGSPNPRLLTVSEPVLCMQCHAINLNRSGKHGASSGSPKFSTILLNQTLMKCSNCHAAVHGSHSNDKLRY